MAKQAQLSASTSAVRMRRAYFDCRFGQLHVRTAFPSTGGFDEGVTLICLHPREESSRTFARFLPHMAGVRSVYAPDLPGCGESDAAPQLGAEEGAHAILDLAADLRLRQIDLLGLRFGAGVALALAMARPDLVRRLVLAGESLAQTSSVIAQPSLVLRRPVAQGKDAAHVDDTKRYRDMLPRATFIELDADAGDIFAAPPPRLTEQISGFLDAP